jgi:hypothetical protein
MKADVSIRSFDLPFDSRLIFAHETPAFVRKQPHYARQARIRRKQIKALSARRSDAQLVPKQADFDIKPVFWKYGFMKTTLDLPDDLMREVKIRAVHEHKKLKDAIADFIRRGMSASKTRRPKIPKPVKLRGGFKPTTEDIEAAIAWGRD